MLLDTYGDNFQNWNKEVRNQIRADKGKKLAQIDQAGAEALIVAYLCKPGNFRSLFENGIKPHVYVALHIFYEEWQETLKLTNFHERFLKCPIPLLTKDPDWKRLAKAIKEHDTNYFIGKKTCHSSNYGMAEALFALSVLEETEGELILSVETAKRFLDTYHGLFPEIREWHSRILVELKRKPPILRNLFGFPRLFTGFWDSDLFREAYAFVPQSTVGTITNIAYTEIGNKIEDDEFPGMDLLQNGHDSILLQAPEEHVLEYVGRARRHLERDLVGLDGVQFRMRTEAAIGQNWAPWSEKNPEGLKEI